jgi:hypothetical protein
MPYKPWFAPKTAIKVPKMEGPYKPVGRPSRFYKNLTNIHHFHVEMICVSLIDNFKSSEIGLMR